MDGFKRGSGSAPSPDSSYPPVNRTLPPVAQPPQSPPSYQSGGYVNPPQPQGQMQQPSPAMRPTELPSLTLAPQQPPKPERPHRRNLWLVLGIGLVVLAVAIGAALFWFRQQLLPVNSADSSDQKVVIEPSESFRTVANALEERRIIRNAVAFELYAGLQGKRSALKEGTCTLHRTETADEVLAKLTSGCHDFMSITFYPGATIEKPLYKPADAVLDQTMYVKYRLAEAGFSADEIVTALGKTYTGPLFAGKPAGTSLEGYVYGETYYVATGASAEQVLQTTFDQMYADMQKNGILEKYQQQGLTLYEGITMASIVQRELNCEGKPTEERKERCYQYQRTIAQVFLKRLREGISLGSDVTFIYAADMLGVPPTVDLDSPYNTRVHTGLPPGPIASPGLLALKAVADPTPTDYLFFIAGDDGLIYFAKDQAGHESNIVNHCQKLCGDL